MGSSRKRKMSSKDEDLEDEANDGLDPSTIPNKIIKEEDSTTHLPSEQEDDERLKPMAEDPTAVDQYSSPLFVIDNVPLGHVEEKLSSTFDDLDSSSDKKLSSVVNNDTHLKGSTDVEEGNVTSKATQPVLSGEETAPNTGTVPEHNAGVDTSKENRQVATKDVSTSIQKITKESKSHETSNRNNKSDIVPTTTSQIQQSSPSSNALEEKEFLESTYVGRVIGKGGEMIRDLQARSGCRIDVDQNVAPGQPRIITYRGSRKTIDFAKNLVHLLCSPDTTKMGDMDLPLGEAKQKMIAVPSSSIGRLIGRGGEMIRELQNRSHAKIQVDHSNTHPDPNIKLITVTGSDSSLIKAEELISCIVEKTSVDAMTALNMFSEERSTRGSSLSYGPTSTYTPPIATRHPGISPTLSNPSQQYHPGVPVDVSHRGGHAVHPPIYGYTPPNSMPAPSIPVPAQHGLTIVREIFPCSKVCMGRIIGRKGITVNDVQKRSGCDIQINQDVPPGRDCEITILGSRPGIDIAKRILMDIIQMGSNHPYAGGEGAASGLNQGMIQHSPGIYQSAPGGAAYMPQQYIPSYPYPVYAPMQYPQYPGYVGVPPMVNTAIPPVTVTWKSAIASDGQPYYYNDKGETTWDKPPGFL